MLIETGVIVTHRWRQVDTECTRRALMGPFWQPHRDLQDELRRDLILGSRPRWRESLPAIPTAASTNSYRGALSRRQAESWVPLPLTADLAGQDHSVLGRCGVVRRLAACALEVASEAGLRGGRREPPADAIVPRAVRQPQSRIGCAPEPAGAQADAVAGFGLQASCRLELSAARRERPRVVRTRALVRDDDPGQNVEPRVACGACIRVQGAMVRRNVVNRRCRKGGELSAVIRPTTSNLSDNTAARPPSRGAPCPNAAGHTAAAPSPTVCARRRCSRVSRTAAVSPDRTANTLRS